MLLFHTNTGYLTVHGKCAHRPIGAGHQRHILQWEAVHPHPDAILGMPGISGLAYLVALLHGVAGLYRPTWLQ